MRNSHGDTAGVRDAGKPLCTAASRVDPAVITGGGRYGLACTYEPERFGNRNRVRPETAPAAGRLAVGAKR